MRDELKMLLCCLIKSKGGGYVTERDLSPRSRQLIRQYSEENLIAYNEQQGEKCYIEQRRYL